ncbi:MAG TPA: hypothetical protein VEU32_06125 [Burkholderiales bacterium]|nr:hypothetical protein [Burkholderiales bacterium]
MRDDRNKEPRFVALCMLGLVLFNFPVLALFNVGGNVFGVPVLYAYIFAAWALVIVLLYWVAER